MKRFDAAVSGVALLLTLVLQPEGGRSETAAENYRLYCVQCHGTRGTGEGINQTAGGLTVSPRDHTDAKQMSKLSDKEIKLAIVEGGDAVDKSELMPPWGATLSDSEIDELVLHLRKLCQCEGGE